MIRGYSPAAITALGQNPEFYHLVKFNFSTPLYYTTAPRDVSYDSQTWLSSAIISKIPSIPESLFIKPNSISLTMAGAALVNQSLTLTEKFNNTDVEIYRYIAATNEAVLEWKGFIQNYKSTEDKRKGKSEITWNCASHWNNWETKNGRILTDEAQQELYAGDIGLNWIGVTDESITDWAEADPDRGGRLERAVTGLLEGAGTIIEGVADSISNVFSNIGNLFGGGGGGGDQPRELAKEDTYNLVKYPSDVKRLPVCYGDARVKGIPVYRSLDPANKEMLYVVYAICEGEIDSLTDVQFKDGESYDSTRLASVCTKVDFYTGTTDQTYSTTMGGVFSEWTSDCRLRGISYCIMKYEKSDEWQGEPTPAFLVKGRNILDIRTGLTATNLSNPVLIAYDYLTNALYGKGLTVSDTSSFSAGATLCETQVYNHDASGTGTYSEAQAYINLLEFNGGLITDNPIKNNMEKILFTARGYLAWIGGDYKLVIAQTDETSVYSFSEDNITGNFEVAEIPSNKKFNRVYCEILDPRVAYRKASFQSSSAQFLSDDNNILSYSIVNNNFENDRYRAKNRAATILKKSREGLRVKLTAANADAIQVEVGQIVDITRDSQGWESKLFRVISLNIGMDATVSFTLEEYESSVYDWDVSVEQVPPEDTLLPDVNTVTAPTGLTAASGATHQITTDDGGAVNRIYVSFTASVDVYVEGYEVQYRAVGDTNYIQLPTQNSIDNVTLYIPNVDQDQEYEVRVRSYNAQGTVSAWVALGAAHSVTGTTAVGRLAQIRGADAYENDSIYFHTFFDGYSGLGFVSGNSSLIITATVSVYPLVKRRFPSSIVPMSWTKNRRFKTRAGMPTTMANLTGNLSFGIGDQQTILTSSGIHFVLKYNATSTDIDVYGSVSNGTTTTETLISSIANASYDIHMEVVYTAGTNVIFYFTGTNPSLVETDSTLTITTNLPVSDGSNDNALMIECSNTSSGTLGLTVSEWKTLQEQ